MTDRFDRFLSALLTVAGVVIALVLVRREFFASDAPPGPQPPTLETRWHDTLGMARQLSNPDAPVQIVEFGDLECPFCRLFHATLEDIRRARPDQIGISWVHYPIPKHRFARPAAQAAECAALEGRFNAMVTSLFEAQDSLGLVSWSRLAHRAGVTDTARFVVCMETGEESPAISAGLRAGNHIELRVTPTILINGWRYDGVLDAERLSRVVDNLLAGKAPPR